MPYMDLGHLLKKWQINFTKKNNQLQLSVKKKINKSS